MTKWQGMGLVSSFQLKFLIVLLPDFSGRAADLFSRFVVVAVLLMALLIKKALSKKFFCLYIPQLMCQPLNS